MKTQHKYISYRKDRACYIVSIRYGEKNEKRVTKTCKTLEQALEQRETLMNLLKLDESILDSNYHQKTDGIPTLEEAFSLYVETEVRPRVAFPHIVSIFSANVHTATI